MEILDLSKVISESPIQVKYNYNQLGVGWGVGMEARATFIDIEGYHK